MDKWQPVGAWFSPDNPKALSCLTGALPPIENTAENSALSNPLTNENPGVLAGTTGVKDVLQGVRNSEDYTASFPILATHWGVV